MKLSNPKQFREQIRILERKLGLLKKNNGSCCAEVLTLAQCHALVEIGRLGTISLKELSVILAIDMSTTSRTVDGLVKKRYVQRIASQKDRRSINISLSDSGKIIFETIETNNDIFFAEIFSNLPDNEKMPVLHALEVILNAFDKES
ncbi:MarR family winged helix-turn-helix transcriptional regulator [Acetobacterium sp.]|uniref:MarR family winged helix-turn-helix transcriptional regulator n=1 Tax=Acetobacterium sp. TaxID=1872094 RepID=UPI00272900AD|nr:MarR family transcriptional regulator [Acetobacterium sp.]MDO9492213.1 MarR family transcriptional regulator [Acetobacterium sp.]